jgi:hypothetical protein
VDLRRLNPLDTGNLSFYTAPEKRTITLNRPAIEWDVFIQPCSHNRVFMRGDFMEIPRFESLIGQESIWRS